MKTKVTIATVIAVSLAAAGVVYRKYRDVLSARFGNSE